MHWRREEFSLGGYTPGGPRVESRGEAPVGVWGRSPPEAEAVCRYRLHVLTTGTIKIWVKIGRQINWA